ncbi:MAG: HAMP domain-containing histidine kinase [Bifidobacteriaceae bacterium]|nr:HAMP domain-containing histidine kinase [Bifidobacteriaceae bacterium]
MRCNIFKILRRISSRYSIKIYFYVAGLGVLGALGSYFLSGVVLERELVNSELADIRSSAGYSFRNIARDQEITTIFTKNYNTSLNKTNVLEQVRELSGSDVVAVYYWNELTGRINNYWAPGSLYTPSIPNDYINQVNATSGASRLNTDPIILKKSNDYFPDNYVLLGKAINIDNINYGVILVYDLQKEYQLARDTSFLASAITTEIIIIMLISVSFILRRTMRITGNLFDVSKSISKRDYSKKVDVRGHDEFALLAKTFNNMQDAIKSNEDAQKRFVSDVSHELKAPVASLSMASEYIYAARETIPKKFKPSIEILHKRTNDFRKLLEDLLEISRTDFGAVNLHLEDIYIEELVKRTKDSLTEFTKEAGITIIIQSSGDDHIVQGDYIKLTRVVKNLLTNAIDYSDKKPVKVRIGQEGENVIISVTDEGPGIDKVDQEKVFNRFYRLDPSRQRTIGGTGLGLTIAKADIEEHGGTLTLESEKGRGSTFTISIPKIPPESK